MSYQLARGGYGTSKSSAKYDIVESSFEQLCQFVASGYLAFACFFY